MLDYNLFIQFNKGYILKNTYIILQILDKGHRRPSKFENLDINLFL